MQSPEPQKQHAWLQQLVGSWTMESEAVMGPDQPTVRSTGSETVRPLGGLWVVCDGWATMPDGNPATMQMTLGYDPAKGRFVGTWVGSMMTHQWVYDGSLDDASRVLTLESEGPSFIEEGKMGRYRDVITIESPGRRTLTSFSLGGDGKWTQFMTARYQRT